MSRDMNELFSKIKLETNVYSPLSAEIDVTYRCPCKCVHCYQENNRLSKQCELDTKSFVKLVDDLYELGTIECIISGGDPLCRKDIWDILSRLRERKMRTILYTSGYLLDEQTCQKIIGLKVARVEMTFLGSDAETHDCLAGTEGSFRNIVSGTKKLKKNGIPVRLKYMLMHMNYLGLSSIKKIEEELDEKIDIIPYLWCKQGGKENEISSMRMTKDEMRDYFRKFPLEGKKKTFVRCNAGKYKIAVDPMGNIKPCSAYASGYNIGNIKDESLQDIWYTNSQLAEMRHSIRYSNVKCRLCEKSMYCVLCPAIATWEGKEPGEIYSPMCEYAEIAKEVADGKI